MIVIILNMIIAKAKIPKGCERKEEEKSPLNKYEIEFPNPHPGQYLKPRFESGQIVKWVASGEFINAR